VGESDDPLLTPAELASLFRVNKKTVTRWAAGGRIRAVITPGGRWRFAESEVSRLLREGQTSLPDPTTNEG
jgi:excisionase family DNA binding protein